MLNIHRGRRVIRPFKAAHHAVSGDRDDFPVVRVGQIADRFVVGQERVYDVLFILVGLQSGRVDDVDRDKRAGFGKEVDEAGQSGLRVHGLV